MIACERSAACNQDAACGCTCNMQIRHAGIFYDALDAEGDEIENE